MKAIEILTREHGLILQALECLTLARDKIEKDQRLPKDFFEKALVFLREFADQFHHFKEEYLVFGLLALKKGGAFDGPIGSLRYQHERCRACIHEISNSLDGYADGDDFATTSLLENLAAYISLLRRHIYEEDHTFFKMAEKELSKEEEDLLLVQFKKEDQKMGDQTFYDQNRKLLDEMETLLNSEGV
jgi:hemerythrin-like domain-containing protein